MHTAQFLGVKVKENTNAMGQCQVSHVGMLLQDCHEYIILKLMILERFSTGEGAPPER